jgi:hypothetical protein
MSRQALIIENIALRSELAIYQHDVTTNKRPKRLPTPAFRQLWVMISRYLVDGQSALMVVTPQTVINWHRTAFRWYWARKSIPPGRPSISRSTITLIKRIWQLETLGREKRLDGVPPPCSPIWSPSRSRCKLSCRRSYSRRPTLQRPDVVGDWVELRRAVSRRCC